MAIHPLSYCNASLKKVVSLQYDDVLHQVTNGSEGTSCGEFGGGAPAGMVIYSHTQGNTKYYVKTQNSYPYAYVQTETVTPCDVAINSVTVGNASTSASNDGSLVVNASATNGVLGYRLNYDPSGFGSSNVFTGLAPGTYTVQVYSANASGFCYAVQEVVVGYNDVVCNLQLGNITVTAPSGPGTNDGSIVVNTISDPYTLQVQYRLDSGAWQSSPNFNGLAGGTYNVQVRYVAFPTCVDSASVSLAISCDIFIQDVILTHESAKFADDGKIQIIAVSSNGTIQYSINNGASYQTSNIFVNLSPGTYNIRVKDAQNCETTAVAIVLKYKKPVLLFPIVNSHRVVLKSGPMVKPNARQNFDNRLFRDMRFPDSEPGCYSERVESTDVNTYQWRSNYTSNTVKIYNSLGVLQSTLSPTKRTAYLNKSESVPALFASAGAGKTQVFFESGLPIFAEIGLDITITDQVALNGTYEIQDIVPGIGAAQGYQVLIINASISALLSGTANFIYDVEPYEVYEVVLDWSAFPVGNYYFTISGTDIQFTDYLAESEPVEIRTQWKDTILLEYKDYDNSYQVNYDTGIVHRLRVQGVLKWPLPGGERTVYKDSRVRTIKLEEYNTRSPQLFVKYLPPYLLEKLKLAFAMDWFTADEVEYQCEEDFEPEYFDFEALHNGTVKLIQVDFQNENSNDEGPDVDATVLDINDTLLAINP